MIHEEAHAFAGKTMRVKEDVFHPQFDNFGGSEIIVEDYWDRIAGRSWMVSDGVPAAIIYGMRSGFADLPTDNEVLYGKIDGYGHLLHVSEVEQPVCMQFKSTINMMDAWHAMLRNGRTIISTNNAKRRSQAVLRYHRCMGYAV